MLPEILQTERLLLRRPERSDAEAIFHGYAQDPLVTRFLLWAPHRSISDTQQFLDEVIQGWQAGTRFPWLILHGESEEVIGMIGLTLDGPEAELGYLLARKAWGQGLMTEAVRAVLDAAFFERRISRISATCDVENRASARVLEKVGLAPLRNQRRYAVHPNLGSEPRDVVRYTVERDPITPDSGLSSAREALASSTPAV